MNERVRDTVNERVRDTVNEQGENEGVVGGSAEKPVEQRWAGFYAAFFRDLRDNLAVMLPLIAVFVFIIVPASSALLCALECGGSVRDVWEAAYVTWQAMTTSGGFGDLAPATPAGRLLISIDALLGYSLLGVIVFIIARAAEKEGRLHTD